MNAAVTAGKRIANTFAESVYDNPVVTREFRTRMRGKRAFIVMGAYVLFLSAVLFLTYYFQLEDMSHNPSGMQLVNRNIGMVLFQSLAWVQAILLSFILPSLTSGALSQELEKKTIEMLALSRLTPGKIALGKQLSGFLYSLVLLVCSVPLAGMCLMFGGISPAEIAVTYTILIAWSFLFTSAGVFWSSLFNKTASATLLCYVTCLGYLLFTFTIGSWTHIPYMSSGFVFIFNAMNPGWAASTSLQVAQVSGVAVPVAAAAFLMHVATGVLLLLVASTHVRHFKVERALPIRLLLMAITAALIWLLMGNTLQLYGAPPTSYASSAIGGFGVTVMVILLLAVPLFATGTPRGAKSGLALSDVFALRKMFKSDLRGATCFMLLWGIVLYGVVGLTILLVANTRGAANTTTWLAYFGTGIATLAMVVGMCSVGILLSSLAATRRSAAALMLVFVLLAFAVYPLAMMWYTEGVSNPNNPVWQIAAWWPMTPFVAMSDGWRGMPKVWWRSEDSWIVSTAAYLALSVIALHFAAAARRKFDGVQDD